MPFLSFLTSPLFKYLVVIGAVLGLLFGVYKHGQNVVYAEWELEKAKTDALIAELQSHQGSATVKVVTKYVDKVRIVKEKGATITEYVDRWITPADNEACVIPPKFIKLHNAAVKNELPKEEAK